MKTYRIHENGQWYHTDHAPDRANGCLIGLMWMIVCIVLGLATLALNGLMADGINKIVSLAMGG
jgi:hypothetical protein